MAVDLPDSVKIVESESGLTVLRVSTPAVAGELYLHGAHVSRWRPAGQADVLWMSAASAFAPATPIRGGVPICYPWFGPGRDGQSSPAHGFARLADWRLVAADDAGGTVSLRLALTDADVAGLPAAQGWQHPFELTYAVSFGAELAVELTVRNTGSEAFSFEEALHTYFGVGAIGRTRIEGLDGAQYLDRAPGAEPGKQTQEGPVTFTGETDRIYSSTSATTVVDVAGDRRITIARVGSADAVVWNPWIAKAAAMPDFGDEEWRDMVCVEAANALDDAVDLQPGATHTMSFRVTVENGSA